MKRGSSIEGGEVGSRRLQPVGGVEKKGNLHEKGLLYNI